jgi:hypothetical protein
MSRELTQMYFASCPFCAYRRLFSSESAMRKKYEAHLYAHESRDARAGLAAGEGLCGRIRRVAEHAERLEAAPYN